MVELSISGLVIPSDFNNLLQVESNDTITAGQVVYRDATNGKKATRGDADALASAAIVGIACNDAGVGEPVGIALTGNSVTFASAILTVALPYFVSPDDPASFAAGGICVLADVLSGDYPTLVGFATSTTVLKLNIVAPGAVVA